MARGIGWSMFRIGVGAAAVGSQELARRIEAITARLEDTARGPADAGPGSTSERLGYLTVGLVVESIGGVAQALNALVRNGRRTVAAIDAVARLPVVSVAAEPARASMRRGGRRVRALITRGRIETLEGRRLFTLLIEETAARSVKDIAESAVKEVSHSRDVAALVRAQSTDMVTDTILEVRANSEQADERLERRVRSWLRIGDGGDGKRQPAKAVERPPAARAG